MASAYATEHRVVQTALREFREKLLAVPEQVRQKAGDRGPLTELDELMDRQLHDTLLERFPDDGWVSEESAERTGRRRVWIIDPIDGTREVVAGIPEWAVSVGLWQDGRPLYGWIYNPPSDALWHGGPEQGAFADDAPISVRPAPDLAAAEIGVSRTDLKKDRIPKVSPAPRGIGSIAYKLGLVAAGKIDATVSVTPKNIWDIAGGIPLILGAGGVVVRYTDGVPLNYWEGTPLVEGGLVAGHPDLAEPLRQRYRAATPS